MASTYGEVTRQRRFGGVNLYDVSLPQRLKLPFHVHRMTQMCIVLEGTYVEEARSQKRILTPGAVLFRPALEVHRNCVGTHNVRTLLVVFEPERSASLAFNEFLAKPVYFHPGVLWNSIQGLKSEMESMVAAEGIILLMVASLTSVTFKLTGPVEYHRTSVTIFLLAGIGVFISGICGGYLAAWIGRRSPFLHATAVLIPLALDTTCVVTSGISRDPVWFDLLNAFGLMFATLCGGLVYRFQSALPSIGD